MSQETRQICNTFQKLSLARNAPASENCHLALASEVDTYFVS